MKRGIALTLIAFTGILVIACFIKIQKNTFPQAKLQKPDKIQLVKGDLEMVFEPADQEFSEIYDSIEKKWWPSGKHQGKPVKMLCLSSKDNISSDDALIIFTYNKPVRWNTRYRKDHRKSVLHIRTYGFLIPQDITEEMTGAGSGDYYKGALLISEDDELFGQANMYVSYFDDDLLNLLVESGFR